MGWEVQDFAPFCKAIDKWKSSLNTSIKAYSEPELLSEGFIVMLKWIFMWF